MCNEISVQWQSAFLLFPLGNFSSINFLLPFVFVKMMIKEFDINDINEDKISIV